MGDTVDSRVGAKIGVRFEIAVRRRPFGSSGACNRMLYCLFQL
jgi:hypothetical protein